MPLCEFQLLSNAYLQEGCKTCSGVVQLFFQKSRQVLVLLCDNSAVKAFHQAVGDLDLSLPPLQGIYSLGGRVRAAHGPSCTQKLRRDQCQATAVAKLISHGGIDGEVRCVFFQLPNFPQICFSPSPWRPTHQSGARGSPER